MLSWCQDPEKKIGTIHSQIGPRVPSGWNLQDSLNFWWTCLLFVFVFLFCNIESLICNAYHCRAIIWEKKIFNLIKKTVKVNYFPGDFSYRDPVKGSFFIQSLCSEMHKSESMNPKPCLMVSNLSRIGNFWLPHRRLFWYPIWYDQIVRQPNENYCWIPWSHVVPCPNVSLDLDECLSLFPGFGIWYREVFCLPEYCETIQSGQVMFFFVSNSSPSHVKVVHWKKSWRRDSITRSSDLRLTT